MGFFDDLLGNSAADASNAAAADTYKKQQAAAAALRNAGGTYSGQMTALSNQFNPYISAGGDALTRLMAGLGLGPGGEDFTAAYHALPGYQAGLDTGTKATTAALNAGNMDQSGRALKTLYRYGSNYEDQRAGDYLSRLFGLSSAGQQATGQKVATAGQGYGGQLSAETGAAGQDFNSAGTVGQGMVAGEQAKQSALQNLMGTAAYLGGAALGGPVGSALGGAIRGSSFSGTSLPRSPYGYSTAYPQIPLYGPGR